MRADEKKPKKILPIVVILLAVVVIGGGAFAVMSFTDKAGGVKKAAKEETAIINPITGLESDEELNARPVMVSIPNAPDGAVPQSNLTYADIIYEFPVEGQLTRLQAVYLTEFPDKLGPIRSVRYYFVDLAREYKAAHVGYGWGKHAHDYMYSSGVPHMNGMQDPDLYYRSSEKSAPNNAYIKWENVMKVADAEKWFAEQKKIRSFKFRDEQWEQEKVQAKNMADWLKKSDSSDAAAALEKVQAIFEEHAKAKSVKVSSTGCNSTCTYNESTGLYDRYWYGQPYIDKETGKQLSFSNIIVQKVKSNIMTDAETGELDPKGRLEIDMNSEGEAYVFTGGEVIKGEWSKAKPDARTIFKDSEGNEIPLTAGKSWVYVVDQNMTFSYE